MSPWQWKEAEPPTNNHQSSANGLSTNNCTQANQQSDPNEGWWVLEAINDFKLQVPKINDEQKSLELNKPVWSPLVDKIETQPKQIYTACLNIQIHHPRLLITSYSVICFLLIIQAQLKLRTLKEECLNLVSIEIIFNVQPLIDQYLSCSLSITTS